MGPNRLIWTSVNSHPREGLHEKKPIKHCIIVIMLGHSFLSLRYNMIPRAKLLVTSSRESLCSALSQTKGNVFTTHPPQTAHNTPHVGETFGPTFLSASNTCLRPSVTEEDCWLLPLPQGTVVGF